MEHKEHTRFRLSEWIEARLTHKTFLLIILIGLAAWLFLCVVFLDDLDLLLRTAYASTLSGAAEEAVVQALRQRLFLNLTIFSVAVFAVLAIALYLLVLAPIIRLRQSMRRYYELSQLPERTDRRDEIGRLQNTFADLVSAVGQKEQAERRLIASISHDIKTPLTSVLGYSERLRSPTLSEEKRQLYLTLIHEKALRIKGIVDEFDEYLDMGLREGDPMAFMTAGGLCRKVQEEFSGELSDAGVPLHVTCDAPAASLFCNWEQFRRLFGNLISNSFQHSGAKQMELSLHSYQEGDRVLLDFWDNGEGVPEDLLEQIFEPLYTSDPGRKVSGLGLPICRSIVRAHGGTIRALNAAEGGLLIRISLPMVKL